MRQPTLTPEIVYAYDGMPSISTVWPYLFQRRGPRTFGVTAAQGRAATGGSHVTRRQQWAPYQNAHEVY